MIEVKNVRMVAAKHRAQVFNYLKATGLRLGLLVNFGNYPKSEIEGIIL
jgi:GxxExxY protein